MIRRASTRVSFVAIATISFVAAAVGAANSSPAGPRGAHSAPTHVRPAGQTYTVSDLGTLPGQSTSYVGDLNLVGETPNKAGQAAGVSEGGSATAVFFHNGTVTNLNTLGANVSLGFGVNNSGQVVGKEDTYSDPCSCFHAFLYSNGSMQVIDSPAQFPAGAEAYGINDSGQIVGVGYLSPSNFHAFLYSGGKMTDLGGGYQARAVAINNAGQAIGNGTSLGAFLYAKGKMIALGVPSGASGTAAFALNSTGQVAGGIYFNSSGPHGGLFSNGAWTDLGAFPGATATLAYGINTSDQVVGSASFPNTYHPFKVGKHVAVFFSNGSAIDLNTLISPNSGFKLTDAVGINDAGQILCDATVQSGPKHAVVLSPQ
jgi:probable HAF family extracellular repeat protein